jgi:hypothetical protein
MSKAVAIETLRNRHIHHHVAGGEIRILTNYLHQLRLRATWTP